MGDTLLGVGTWGVSMVKDEADVIGYTIAHMLDEVDALLIADNGSTDGTRDILADWRRRDPERVLIVDDPEVGYYQSVKMSALAYMAATRGAGWVVPFDADEWWCAPWGPIRDVLAALPPVEGIAPATLYDHVTTAMDDPTEGSPFARIRWRRATPGPFPKVAVRPVVPVVIAQGNHGASYATLTTAPNPVLEVRHFPYRSPEQMVRKAVNGKAAYDATDLPDTEGKHWRDYGRVVADHGPEALHEHYLRWFHSTAPVDDGLIEDPIA